MDFQVQAGAARDRKNFEEAREFYRKAIITDSSNSGVYVNYINMLISLHQYEVAWEISRLLTVADPSHIQGLELYLELAKTRKDKNQSVTKVMRNFSEDVRLREDRHRAALDFLIPHKSLEAIEYIANHSSDDVARAVAQADMAIRSHVPTEKAIAVIEGCSNPNLALAILWLARGKAGSAIEALAKLDSEEFPFSALRQAIRRAKNVDKMKQAAKYAEIYSTKRPQDKWIKNIANTFNTKSPSNYLLGKQGYKFPALKKNPEYSVQQKKVFYLLHNSLPHHSAGYATRTHGLLSELNNSEWTVDGVTRLGYPYDMPGMAEIDDVSSADRVGRVDYRRLLAGRDVEKKNPLFDYVQRYSQHLQRLAKSEKPAIIHAASNHWNGLAAVTAANRLGIPSVYEVRGLWEVTRGSRDPEWATGNMYKFMARMEADAAKGATRVFAITRALKDELVNRGVDPNKIEIIPNGVDTNRFQPQARDAELARRLNIQGKTVIGYVGSILDYEGIELLIESAGNLKSERNDFHVLIVGDGAELEKFRNRVAEESLGDVITFTGRVPHEDVESYYSLIDITPFPRLPLPVCEMVSPLKPFEAMAMGKAVVASNVDALEEIIVPGLNGLLHEKGSQDSLTSQLRLLLEDEELRAKLGSQAREWVVEERDWSKLASIISNTYDDLWKLQTGE
ncbi:glycosyltransferase family 4 protein [Glutamicibacter sp. AOP5-A2-7]